jgi:hypothetical protein
MKEQIIAKIEEMQRVIDNDMDMDVDYRLYFFDTLQELISMIDLLNTKP